MFKRNRFGSLVLILGLVLAGWILFEPQLVGSSDPFARDAKDGYNGQARVFVKGDHAYVLRLDPFLPPSSYLWVFDVEVVGDSITDTIFTEACCDSIFVPKASDLFVSGNYLYVAGVYGASSCIVRKYDTSDPCDPVFVDSAIGYMLQGGGTWLTEIYITGDRAYLAIDASGVVVFAVSDTLFEWDTTFYTNYSSQGVHVRGSYMYVGNEGQGLWVRDLSTGNNYYADTTDAASRDAYNVGCDGKSRTYETTDYNLWVWDTDDLEDISKVGSTSTPGHTLHITGYWVYSLRPPHGSVKVFALVCDGNPQLKKTYGNKLHDLHVVHDSKDYAHIYGVKPVADSDTAHVLLWYKKAKHQMISRLWKYGDINRDWIVNIADLYILSRYVIAGDNYPIPDLDACDVNCDGEINTDDCDYLADYLFGGGPAPGADCQFYH
jgi:hypothetical protein